MSLAPPLIAFHVCAAAIGLLSGALAMTFRKGSGRHGAAGSVFVAAMLTMSATAAFIASFMRPNMLNVVVGLLTFYLVSTGWWAVKRQDGITTAFDRGALLLGSTVGIGGIAVGIQAARSVGGSRDGIPAALYFMFGTVALLFSAADVRMVARGGVVGAKRISRHLLRMCIALLIATFSFFPGQAKLFPVWLVKSGLLVVPHVLLIGTMIFWLVRLRGRRRASREERFSAGHGGAIVGSGA